MLLNLKSKWRAEAVELLELTQKKHHFQPPLLQHQHNIIEKAWLAKAIEVKIKLVVHENFIYIMLDLLKHAANHRECSFVG